MASPFQHGRGQHDLTTAHWNCFHAARGLNGLVPNVVQSSSPASALAHLPCCHTSTSSMRWPQGSRKAARLHPASGATTAWNTMEFHASNIMQTHAKTAAKQLFGWTRWVSGDTKPLSDLSKRPFLRRKKRTDTGDQGICVNTVQGWPESWSDSLLTTKSNKHQDNPPPRLSHLVLGLNILSASRSNSLGFHCQWPEDGMPKHS